MNYDEGWNERLFRKYACEDRYVHQNALIRWAANKRADSIVEALKLRPNERVLDVGCGSGYVIKRMRASHMIGVDLSDTALKMARQNLVGMENVSLVKADAASLPFDDCSFDKIVCADVLEHVPDPRNAMREIERVANRGATIIIALPNESMQRGIVRLLRKAGFSGMLKGVDEHREWHIHEASPGFFSRVNNGLRVDRVLGSPSFCMPLTHIFVCRKK